MTASAHVLVFRPLIEILRGRGDEVEVTARDYAQTLQLLELHGLEATVLGRHGGRSRAGKAQALATRLLDDHVSGRADLSRQLWGLLAFTLWHQRHVERAPGAVRPGIVAATVA